MTAKKFRSRPPLLIAEQAVSKIPPDRKAVLKNVPAKIYWRDIRGSDREDDEVIGEAIIYDDGSTDVIVFEDITSDARNLIYGLRGSVDYLSLGSEQNGISGPEQGDAFFSD